jgi:cell shape-determining protein MreC
MDFRTEHPVTEIPPIPEDLQALYEIAKVTGENIPFTPTKLRAIIERIAKLTADIERLKDEDAKYQELQRCYELISHWAGEARRLEAENARLKAPVSDEESYRLRAQYENRVTGTIETSLRRVTDNLIASRAAIKEGQ